MQPNIESNFQKFEPNRRRPRSQPLGSNSHIRKAGRPWKKAWLQCGYATNSRHGMSGSQRALLPLSVIDQCHREPRFGEERSLQCVSYRWLHLYSSLTDISRIELLLYACKRCQPIALQRWMVFKKSFDFRTSTYFDISLHVMIPIITLLLWSTV